MQVSSSGVPPGGLSPGGSATVPVTVTADNGPVSNISLVLKAGSAGTVKITQTPAGTNSFSLSAGQSRTFTYSVSGVKPGQAVLRGTATGSATDSSTVTGTGTATFQVALRALKMTIATDPDKVRLEADDDGSLQSKQIVVTVKLTNTSKSKVTGVQLIGLDPAPATRGQQLDKLEPDGSVPNSYGTLKPGKPKVKTFHLRVTGDGTYVINGLALYSSPSVSGSNQRASGQGQFRPRRRSFCISPRTRSTTRRSSRAGARGT